MFSVAIDGPAGAGKSTISKAIAKELKLIHVDTGAMYRAIAVYFLEKGQDPADREVVVPQLSDINVTIGYENNEQHVYVNGSDVTGLLRSNEASMGASAVSAMPEVRAFLLDLQRSLAKTNNVVMDGRDIGTVVLPDATVKIFLTAAVEARAQRRYKENCEKGIECDYESVLNDVKRRDHNDSTRAAAPLKQADDAVLVDTSALNFEESVEKICELVKAKM